MTVFPDIQSNELRATAVAVATEAAGHIRRRRPELFGAGVTDRGGNVSAKSTPTDPVTVADTEAEDLIRRRLAELRPGEPILGEEEGGSVDVPAGVRWVVDPIDGTVNFLYGVPAYAVSVAAQVDGISVAGAVVDVAGGHTYHAARGQGAVRDADGESVTLQCNAIDDVRLALVATGFGYAADLRQAQGQVVAKLLPRVRDIRRIGSAALDLCMVAAGVVDAHYEHGLSPWDWAAGSLIATEAGAHVQIPAPTSRAADRAVTVVTAPGIYADFTRLLTEAGGDGPL